MRRGSAIRSLPKSPHPKQARWLLGLVRASSRPPIPRSGFVQVFRRRRHQFVAKPSLTLAGGSASRRPLIDGDCQWLVAPGS